MKILIIEDEEVLAKVIQEKLERTGDDVAVAADGNAAITVAQSFRPDIIVLDLLLPKRNGFEVLQILKADQQLKMIPVIVVSNLGEESDIKRALSLGAVDYYVKSEHPINEIIEKIKSILIRSK
ncbi:MAG: response regulator transcription factor [Minisyncoccota bacterium]